MGFPDNCIRGIKNERCLLEDGITPNVTLFEFHDNAGKDNWVRESINWMDDQQAIDFTWRQINADDGTLQFPVGIAILLLTELNRIKRRHFGFFDYEREVLEANSYHGNLLLKAGIEKQRKTLVRAALANNSKVHLQKDRLSA